MLQSEALTSIRARLNEPTEVYWSDIDLRRWINETAMDMARRTESLRGTYDQAVVAGTSSYTPAFTSTQNIFRAYRVEFKPTGDDTTFPLEYRDPNAMDEVWGVLQGTEGTPLVWTSWGYPPTITFQVFPSPSRAGTLRIWYYRLAKQLATATNADAAVRVDIVDGWDDVLVDGVEWKALRRDSDPRWSEAKQLYEQNLAGMMESTIRFTDAQPTITSTFGTNVPMWLYAGVDDF